MAPTRLFDRFRGGTAPGGRVAAPTAPLAAAPAGAADRPIARSPGRQWEGGDPITRLPELAAKKLARLRRQHSEAGVLLRDLDEKRARAGEAKQRAEANVDRLRQTRASGGSRMPSRSSYVSGHGGLPDPGPGGMQHYEPPAATDGEGRPLAMGDQGQPVAMGDRVREAEAELEAAKAALYEINRDIEEKSARRSRLPETLTQYLRDLPAGIGIELHHDNRAGGKSSKPLSIGDLEALRERIGQLNIEVSAVRSAPPPIATVIDRMREQVGALAERARPDYLGAVEAGQPIKFRELQVQSQVATPAGVGIALQSIPDVFGLFCYVHGDALIQKLEADLTQLADDDGALTDQQKAEREQELRDQILEVERDAETAISELELSGAVVARRDDADPRAVLGLSGDLPAPGPMF